MSGTYADNVETIQEHPPSTGSGDAGQTNRRRVITAWGILLSLGCCAISLYLWTRYQAELPVDDDYADWSQDFALAYGLIGISALTASTAGWSLWRSGWGEPVAIIGLTFTALTLALTGALEIFFALVP